MILEPNATRFANGWLMIWAFVVVVCWRPPMAASQGLLFPGNKVRQPASETGRQSTVRPSPPRQDDAAADLEFELLQVYDRMVDHHAFRMLIPVGRKASGGIVWRPNASNLAVSSMAIRDPSRQMGVFLYPTDAFCFSNGLAGYGFHRGTNYLGNEVQSPINRISEYVERIVLSRYRGRDLRAHVVSTVPLPAVATAVKEAIAEPGMQKKVLAAKVRIEYVSDGIAI